MEKEKLSVLSTGDIFIFSLHTLWFSPSHGCSLHLSSFSQTRCIQYYVFLFPLPTGLLHLSPHLRVSNHILKVVLTAEVLHNSEDGWLFFGKSNRGLVFVQRLIFSFTYGKIGGNIQSQALQTQHLNQKSFSCDVHFPSEELLRWR